MSSITPLIMTLYFVDLHGSIIRAIFFARFPGSSSFLCIFSTFSNWSNQGEMQI